MIGQGHAGFRSERVSQTNNFIKAGVVLGEGGTKKSQIVNFFMQILILDSTTN